ncbi:MAG: chromosome segregation ATPase [Geobacteraceae bacterium GWC2_55_20]|nr:MAG: chromosome segregation ATPase [Geobacteraceae bacterium GWC2_55_20]
MQTKDARLSELNSENKQLCEKLTTNISEIERLKADVASLARFRIIGDAEEKAKSIVAAAQAELDAARKAAADTQNTASQNARNQIEAASIKLAEAGKEADRIIAAATRRAEEVAGDAYKAMQNAENLESAAKAMKNLIEGYGDQYIIPTYSLLDELADEFGYAEAGAELKKARERTRYMVKNGRAAACDYVENNRKETAIRFIVDAFNGKVDSILSRTKADNIGTLQQSINDAFSLVNYNGAAFRNARITQEFLEARLEELKWAVVAMELRDRDREEQRRIKDQIREEERARREFEKAIRDAEKEEDLLRKAMDKVRKEVERASEEQKAGYEAKLQALSEKLREAEERSQRAMSMAQQTRCGHVYVISNIGSFGEDVYKIGMTRRLEPGDRVRELGDASVPFEFDIHAMIYSEDAPTLEKTLHKSFLRAQLNKVNTRKEFFKVSLSDIRNEVDKQGVQTHWTITAAAKDYRESLAIEQALLRSVEVKEEWLKQQIEAVEEDFILTEAVEDAVSLSALE